jgi:glycosyltransferase involved in cell wall biosynthesis
MMRQFIIVNNGMTEMRGHYVETALSVAEAARRAGFRPSLAVHVDCPTTGLTDWLAVHAAFRVNHWGDTVRLERASTITRLKTNVRRMVPRFVRDLLRKKKSPDIPHTDGMPGDFSEALVEQTLAHRMSDPATNHDLFCSRLFLEDMRQLLRHLDAGPEDHVFLPTAHFREAYAIRRLSYSLGKASPRFHLEFRHAVVPDGSAANVEPHLRHISRIGQWYFAAIQSFPPTDRVAYFTDTEELAEDYQRLCGIPFGVLPIPFAHDLIRNSPIPGTPPFTCVYLGDIREEKGFQLLPNLVRNALPTGKVRFAFQATQIHPSARTAELIQALAEVGRYKPEQVELVGRDRPFLERDEYYKLLGRADIVLCTHDPVNYRARSSGILAEAIAAGKPVIVPADTWLAHQLPPGCGETFTSEESLANTVREICDKYISYHCRLQECRDRWLARHSPEVVLNRLVADPGTEALPAAA